MNSVRMLFYMLFVMLSYSVANAQLTYVRPISIPPGPLDTSASPDETSAFIYSNVFDTLFTFGSNGEITGSLAKSWNISDNGSVLSILLRNDVYFHSGTKLKSSDVKYSIERLMNSKGHVSSFLSPIKKIDVDDVRNKVDIRLKSSNPLFLVNLTDSAFSILQRGQSSSDLNGTGPFKVASVYRENKMILVKNEKYFGMPAYIEKLVLHYFERGDAIAAFLAGRADDLFHFYLSKDEMRSLDKACRWTFELMPTFRFVVLKRNKESRLRNLQDRECVAASLNRPALIQKWAPGQPILNRLLPNGIYGGNLVSNYNVQGNCSKTAHEALVRKSKSAPIRIAAPVGPNGSIGEALGETLRESGLQVEVRRYPEAFFFDSFSNVEVDMYAARFTPRIPDSESYMHAFLGSKPFFPNGDTRQTTAKRVSEVEATASREVRAVAIASMFDELHRERVFFPIHQFEFNGCIAPKWAAPHIPLTGFISQDMNLVRLEK